MLLSEANKKAGEIESRYSTVFGRTVRRASSGCRSSYVHKKLPPSYEKTAWGSPAKEELTINWLWTGWGPPVVERERCCRAPTHTYPEPNTRRAEVDGEGAHSARQTVAV